MLELFQVRLDGLQDIVAALWYLAVNMVVLNGGDSMGVRTTMDVWSS